MFRLASRLLVVAGLTALAVAVTAGPALAHVSVDAPDATQGGFTVVSFRVPTESETASTTGLKVQLPADQPLASVSVKPKAGWTYTTQTAKLATPIETDDGQVTEAVSVIDWTAASPAAGIKPGEFDEFQISVGPLPNAAAMVFKAIQTYSDGKQVAWIDEPAPGSTAEPEHPAPTLTLAAAAAETGGASPSPTASAAAGTGSATTTPAAAADDVSTGTVVGAYVVGGAGLLAGLAGLALAARRRRATVVDVKQQSVGADAE
jgi:uncharacterized protein YcnI